MRTLVACGLVQQHIGFGVIGPQHALHRVLKTFMHIDVFKRIITGDQALAHIDLHKPKLNEARANTARAKTLGIQNILQLHKGAIVIAQAFKAPACASAAQSMQKAKCVQTKALYETQLTLLAMP